MEEHSRYFQVAIDAAKKAGQIQTNYYGRSYSVEYKGESNPVTAVDKLCEEAIVQKILDAFPEHDILTEESPFNGKGSRWRWIIDPLDGTTNYLHGFPFFSVSIGLEMDGEIMLGAVHAPVFDELYYAKKGGGAFLNGSRISVSSTDELRKSFLGTGFPYDVRENVDSYLRYFRQFVSRSYSIRRPGSASIDLCYLAAGRFDGFWELKLHPWDVAAGSLIVREAGGKVTDFKGQPYSIYSEEILASNGLIHEQMLQVIREIGNVKT